MPHDHASGGEPEMTPQEDNYCYGAVYSALMGVNLTVGNDRVRDWLNAHELHDLTLCPICEMCNFEHKPDCQLAAGMRMVARVSRRFAAELTAATQEMPPDKESKPS